MTEGTLRVSTGIRIFLLACACMMWASCRKTGDSDGAASHPKDRGIDMTRAREGQRIFRSRTFGIVEIACADCHAEHEDRLQPPERLLSGHSILGAAARQLAWNGEFRGKELQRTAAGAAKCALVYQQRGKSIESALSEIEADALMAFYAAISTGSEPSRLPWSAVTYPGDTTMSSETLDRLLEPLARLRGNAQRGEDIYRRACGLCHGPGGLELGPALKTQKKSLDDIPRLIRAGKGSMPFFSRDKLSDADIADIVAYVERNG